MDLENAIGVLRPRRPWEAIDFGWLVGRRLYKDLWSAWALVAFPLCFALIATNWSRPWVAVAMLWLLRPIMDTPLLFVLSRGLFGQPSGLKALWPELRGVLWGELGWRLTLRRLDSYRSYRLPIGMLEGLRGRHRRERVRVLMQRQGAQAAEFTQVCLALELIVMMGLFGLVFLMLPEALHPDWLLFFDDELWSVPRWGRFVFLGQVVAMTVVQPLYVAGGFGLYLNRRTLLEGWDIQLAFRRLARRAANLGAATLLALTLVLSVAVPTAFAEDVEAGEFEAFEDDGLDQGGVEGGGTERWVEGAEEIDAPSLDEPASVLGELDGDLQEQIDTILEHEEFGWDEPSTVWQRRQPAENAPPILGFLGSLLGQLAEVLLWIAALSALGFLLLWLARASRVASLPQSAPARELPTELMGFDVRPESLPDNVQGAARALLEAGNRIEALSLLYRAALARLVHGYQLTLEDGATENDCVRAVRAASGPTRWFESLTRAWQSEAYAHRPLQVEAIGELIDEWTLAIETPEGAP